MAVVHGRQEPVKPVAGRQFSLFGRQFAIMEGDPPDRSGARSRLDIVAGVTLGALAIPEVMGYTKIAGMPVITGLYTILIPIALFALLGSSRHLVVGADSATAAIMAAGLAGLAATASPQYVALAGLLALITAAILLIARFIGLGFLADFLSRTVLIGFLTGVGIQVAIGQISGMLGLPGGGGGTLQKLITDIQQLPQTSLPTLLVSLIVLALIIGCKRFAPNIPGALIAVVGMIAASYFFNLCRERRLDPGHGAQRSAHIRLAARRHLERYPSAHPHRLLLFPRHPRPERRHVQSICRQVQRAL